MVTRQVHITLRHCEIAVGVLMLVSTYKKTNNSSDYCCDRANDWD